MKSTLRTSGEVLVLIGAIIATILNGFALLANFWWILPIFWFIPVIVFTWVTRHIVITKDSQAWIIFGIVLSFFSNWIGLAGYICLLIENIRTGQQVAVSNQQNTTVVNENPFTGAEDTQAEKN